MPAKLPASSPAISELQIGSNLTNPNKTVNASGCILGDSTVKLLERYSVIRCGSQRSATALPSMFGVWSERRAAMTKRRAFWLSIATVLVVAALYAVPTTRYLLLGSLKREPFERGRPLSYWIDELKDEDAARREEAAATLGCMVPQAKVAVPTLIQVIKDDDPKVRQAAIAALSRLGPYAQDSVPALLQVYEDRNEEREIRWAAIAALGKMGTGGQDAVPVMIEMMANDINFAEPGRIQMAVTELGPAAVPELVHLLQDENPEVRAHAAVALNWIGRGAREAVPALIQSLEDEANSVRQAAAFALLRMGPESKNAVPALIQALHDADPEVRRVAAMALEEVDPNAAATEGVK